MYKHVPVSSGRSPLVPVVRNEKESRHRDATHIMYICVYLDCRQPTGTRKGETNIVIRQADLVMCSTIQSEDWKPSSWASFKQPRGSALERASGIRFWNTLLEYGTIRLGSQHLQVIIQRARTCESSFEVMYHR